MADVVNVKWPGQNIADDSTHRLVTDEQIDRWNNIDKVLDDTKYIELTPENISQYTCTKADEYWTDMGLADGTIFDSSSLDEGNYIIKLGMDKLIKNPNVSAPNFRFGKEGYTYDEFWKKYSEIIKSTDYPVEELESALEELYINFYNQFGYQTYVNYTIETKTFLFLCMFFNVELSLVDLLQRINYSYGCEFVLSTTLQSLRGHNTIDESPYTEIKWPESIRIKITKEPYGPENNMYVLKRNIFFDMNIIDYFNCYNYKYTGDDVSDMSLTDQDYEVAVASTTEVTDENGVNIGVWEPCEFTGVPVRNISKGNCSVPYYTTALTPKTARDYVVQSIEIAISQAASLEYSPNKMYESNIYEMFDGIYIRPNRYNPKRGEHQTIIDTGGISVIRDDLIYLDNYFLDIDNYGSMTQVMEHKSNGVHISATHLRLLGYNNLFEIDDTTDSYFLYKTNNDYDLQQWTFQINPYGLTLESDRNNSTLAYAKFIINDEELIFYCDSDASGTQYSKKYTMGAYGLDAEFRYPLNIKINDTNTVSYNNTEEVTVDLTALDAKNTKVTDWDLAVVAGHYHSDLTATNAPYSSIENSSYIVPSSETTYHYYRRQSYGFAGSVECVSDKCIIQHLYSTTNYDMNQYIRKAVYDPDDTIAPYDNTSSNGWKFGEWFEIEYGIKGITMPSGFDPS